MGAKKWVTILEIGRAIGDPASVKNHDCFIVKKQISRIRPKVEIVRIRARGSGFSALGAWAVSSKDVKRILKELQPSEVVRTTPFESRIDWEAIAASEIEALGYWVINTNRPGLSDLVGLRKRKNGGFDVIYREVKSPGATTDKEQIDFLDRHKKMGVDASFRWFTREDEARLKAKKKKT